MKNSIAQFKIVSDSSYSIMLSLSDREKQILIFGLSIPFISFKYLVVLLRNPSMKRHKDRL